jgi:hypothetical protein
MAHSDFRLKRASAKYAPRRRFVVYCEGRNTEPAYFDALKRSFTNALIDLEVIPTGVPMTIAEHAVVRAKREGLARGSRKPRNSFELADQVWAVFDRDEHPNFSEAITLCERYGVKIGRSNPCFEIWLILHEEDYQRPDDRHQVCRHLRTLRREYDPNGDKTCDCAEMIARVEIAEQRASSQLTQRENEGAPYGRPSTTVGALTFAIREAARAARRK